MLFHNLHHFDVCSGHNFVDHNLKVYGIDNLRVVDASIMPTMLSANIHAGAMMIAEKASDLILDSAY